MDQHITPFINTAMFMDFIKSGKINTWSTILCVFIAVCIGNVVCCKWMFPDVNSRMDEPLLTGYRLTICVEHRVDKCNPHMVYSYHSYTVCLPSVADNVNDDELYDILRFPVCEENQGELITHHLAEPPIGQCSINVDRTKFDALKFAIEYRFRINYCFYKICVTDSVGFRTENDKGIFDDVTQNYTYYIYELKTIKFFLNTEDQVMNFTISNDKPSMLIVGKTYTLSYAYEFVHEDSEENINKEIVEIPNFIIVLVGCKIYTVVVIIGSAYVFFTNKKKIWATRIWFKPPKYIRFLAHLIAHSIQFILIILFGAITLLWQSYSILTFTRFAFYIFSFSLSAATVVGGKLFDTWKIKHEKFSMILSNSVILVIAVFTMVMLKYYADSLGIESNFSYSQFGYHIEALLLLTTSQSLFFYLQKSESESPSKEIKPDTIPLYERCTEVIFIGLTLFFTISPEIYYLFYSIWIYKLPYWVPVIFSMIISGTAYIVGCLIIISLVIHEGSPNSQWSPLLSSFISLVISFFFNFFFCYTCLCINQTMQWVLCLLIIGTSNIILFMAIGTASYFLMRCLVLKCHPNESVCVQ